MKILQLPYGEGERVFLPENFSQFSTFFGVEHEDGRQEIRWFVDISKGDADKTTNVGVKHVENYNRWTNHQKSVVIARSVSRNRHSVVMRDKTSEKEIVIWDVAELADEFADIEEAFGQGKALFHILEDWIGSCFKDVDDKLDIRPFVLMAQHILFPYYVHRRMMHTYGSDHSQVSIEGAFKIYRECSWFPTIDIYMMERDGIVLNEMIES